MESGSLLKLTVAQWFTPKGKNIDEEDLEPRRLLLQMYRLEATFSSRRRRGGKSSSSSSCSSEHEKSNTNDEMKSNNNDVASKNEREIRVRSYRVIKYLNTRTLSHSNTGTGKTDASSKVCCNTKIQRFGTTRNP